MCRMTFLSAMSPEFSSICSLVFYYFELNFISTVRRIMDVLVGLYQILNVLTWDVTLFALEFFPDVLRAIIL